MTQQSYTVLIADDSAFARRVVASYLNETEFRIVASAENGTSAVELFKKHKPDIVMLDVILPDISGSDVLRAIMEVEPQAKVLMVSSIGTESMVTECLSVGAKAFVQKPADKTTVLEHLRKLVS